MGYADPFSSTLNILTLTAFIPVFTMATWLPCSLPSLSSLPHAPSPSHTPPATHLANVPDRSHERLHNFRTSQPPYKCSAPTYQRLPANKPRSTPPEDPKPETSPPWLLYSSPPLLTHEMSAAVLLPCRVVPQRPVLAVCGRKFSIGEEKGKIGIPEESAVSVRRGRQDQVFVSVS